MRKGLTVDEVGLHADRLRLWGEFNTAWLSIFQRQKDMLESGQRVQLPQSLISRDFISKMARDLVRMCDGIEKHGLIDYQCGVAEERIMQGLFLLLVSTFAPYPPLTPYPSIHQALFFAYLT